MTKARTPGSSLRRRGAGPQPALTLRVLRWIDADENDQGEATVRTENRTRLRLLTGAEDSTNRWLYDRCRGQARARLPALRLWFAVLEEWAWDVARGVPGAREELEENVDGMRALVALFPSLPVDFPERLLRLAEGASAETSRVLSAMHRQEVGDGVDEI